METIRNYLLSVTVAAILCGIITGFISKKGITGKLLGLLAGLFLTCCVIAPIFDFEKIDFSVFDNTIAEEAESAAVLGESLAEETRRRIIIENTKSYILDKANTMELDIEVEVTLDSTTSVPAAVSIKGNVSPYAKKVLSSYMENTLGIAEENQKWT